MPSLALQELCFDEFDRRAATALNIAPKTLPQVEVHPLITPKPPGFEQRSTDDMVAFCQTNAVIYRTDRMPHLEAKVPQKIENFFDHLLAARHQLVGHEEQQIDVGIGCQFPAAIAANGNQRQHLAGREVGGWVAMERHVVVEHSDQLISQMT